MKNGFIISLSAHTILLLAVFLPVAFGTRVLPTGLVYDVNLVSLPAGAQGGPEARAGGDDAPDATVAAEETPADKPRLAEPAKEKAEKKTEKNAAKKNDEKAPKKESKKSSKGEGTDKPSDSGLHSLVKGGTGSGGGGVGIPGFSSQLQLDIENFEFSYYLVAVRNKVSSNWSPPAGLGTQTTRARTVVYFRIMRNGRVGDAKTESQSGFVLFDQSALRAVLRSEPFPPLPGGFPGGSLGVHFGFEYAR
jgi:TonB family protein